MFSDSVHTRGTSWPVMAPKEVLVAVVLGPERFGWFQAFDNGEGAGATPDQSSLVGFGDEAANEAFCNSPNLPRFGPWDIEGNIQVRAQ